MKRLIFIFMSIILFSSQTSADEKFIEIKILLKILRLRQFFQTAE